MFSYGSSELFELSLYIFMGNIKIAKTASQLYVLYYLSFFNKNSVCGRLFHCLMDSQLIGLRLRTKGLKVHMNKKIWFLYL